jgi:hypothetical protein
MPDATNVPSGAMVELTADLIDEGLFLKQLNIKLRKAHRELKEYVDETGDGKAKAVLMCRVELCYDADAEDFIAITHNVGTRIPTPKKKTFVKERGGRMLVQPIGSTDSSPDQMSLFDREGRVIGRLNTRTGEIEASNKGASESGVVAKLGG